MTLTCAHLQKETTFREEKHDNTRFTRCMCSHCEAEDKNTEAKNS